MKAITIGAMLMLTALAGSAAADIIQSQWNQSLSLGSGGNTNHRGQTFLADASVAQLGSIGFFYYGPVNQTLPASQPTITLYQGFGYGGTVVHASAVDPIPADSTHHWVDADFSGVTLTPGQLYTIQLNQPTEPVSGAYAIYASTTIDIYTDGEFLSENGTGFTNAHFDMAFRVQAAVPEPATCSLLLMAVLGMVWRRRHGVHRSPGK